MGEFSPVKLLIHKSPLLLKTTASHVLGLSENSSKWTLKSELAIELIRSLLNDPKPWPISKQQRLSLIDNGVKGKMWVSKVVMPAPEEEDVKNAVLGAVDALKEKDATYTIPELKAVEAEWTGFRPGASNSSARPQVSEAEQYALLMKDTTSDVTFLYLHGGALYLMDPATHRIGCSRLAKETGGRCFSVRYRLAPQNPFPAALIDVFLAYLSLLCPPPGAIHSAVPAGKIVFAGDSAGGNLCLVLLQLLPHLRRSASSPATVRFHGVDVPIDLPAGLALNSPWTDLTACMPSYTANLRFDYLPPPDRWRTAQLPACDAWPSNPPRSDLYCASSMLCHPLVSPMAASASSWRGAPPVWIVVGDECLYDEGRAVAARMVSAAVPVEWWHFEAMPHVFSMILTDLTESRLCFDVWGKFARRVTGQSGKAEDVETKGIFVTARTVKQRPIDMNALAPMSDDELERRMGKVQSGRVKLREEVMDGGAGREVNGEKKVSSKL